ncbi:MAG TPA: hypothetical protein DIT13_19480, partial [Verrucomicrobiales bacterium]|nr:hypothetical protein [Verrucomicrobiales bacterium]
CHDHKFDPVTQRDYYALAGIFLSSEPLYGTYSQLQNLTPSTLIELDLEAGQIASLASISAREVQELKNRVSQAAEAAEQVQRE